MAGHLVWLIVAINARQSCILECNKYFHLIVFVVNVVSNSLCGKPLNIQEIMMDLLKIWIQCHVVSSFQNFPVTSSLKNVGIMLLYAIVAKNLSEKEKNQLIKTIKTSSIHYNCFTHSILLLQREYRYIRVRNNMISLYRLLVVVPNTYGEFASINSKYFVTPFCFLDWRLSKKIFALNCLMENGL